MVLATSACVDLTRPVIVTTDAADMTDGTIAGSDDSAAAGPASPDAGGRGPGPVDTAPASTDGAINLPASDTSGPANTVVALSGLKTIDGVAGDWAAEPSYPIAEPSPDYNLPLSADDFSGSFRAAWDATYLYILAEITDNEVDAKSSANIYENDCIEVMIDGRHDRNVTFGADDHQVMVSAAGATEASGHKQGDGRIVAAAARTQTGYLVEVAIRWDFIGGNAPRADQLFGFDFAVDDRDGGRRESQVLWKYTPNHWKNASRWGDLLLR